MRLSRHSLLRRVRHVVLAVAVSSGSAVPADKDKALAPPAHEPAITAEDRQHWAFRTPRRPPLPVIADPVQALQAIDYFLLANLEPHGLALQPEAPPETLLRRLTFDLAGLPPSPDEIDAFLADTAPGAYERLVDRLLASPAYGERWAQHWLDVVRYADTDGFEFDKIRPDSWRYRDWVIGALNRDLPFNRFVELQIAADVIDPGQAAATGFLLAGPDMPDINLTAERRHNILNEMTSTVGAAFLGLSVGCAQCHDHRHDPISQADFYRLRSYFSNTLFPKRNEQLGYRIRERDVPPPRSHVMIRGDFRRPGIPVEPAFLRILDHGSEGKGIAQGVKGSPDSRRRLLARRMTRDDDPLITRVIVNRLWQHHFGRPIVDTPNDFGTRGALPSHPQLLDWLATELPLRNWSLKRMQRLMVTSGAYRQISRGSGGEWERALAADPDNRLWSRMNRKRLDGEAIRDAMLVAAGRLNRWPGGAGSRPPLPREVTMTLLKNQWKVSEDESEHHRRSIYLLVRRNLRFPLFDVFDRPDPNMSCARRAVSTTAPQALTLLNSAFSLRTARLMAGRVLIAGGADRGRLIEACYRHALGRKPEPSEIRRAEEFLLRQTEFLRGEKRPVGSLALPIGEDGNPVHGAPVNVCRDAAIVDFCLAIINLNEMIYVD